MSDKKDYTTVDVVTPKDGVYKVYVNYWWWCEYGDPKRAVIFKGFSAQCNKDKRVLESMSKPYEGCKIIQIPVAYKKW